MTAAVGTGAYDHTQRGLLHWGLLAIGAATAGTGIVVGKHPESIVLLVVGLVLALFSCSFAWLRVRDAGDALAVEFGPLPLLRRRIPYAGLRSAERSRSRAIDGWGVHWVPGRGWTWNLSGFDCVEMQTDRGLVRVGTDDPDGLTAFLRSRIPD